MTSDQSSLIGCIIDDKVRLEAILGQGGMGAVYRGRHLLLDRVVAVKVLRSEILTVEGALERFFREARMAAAAEHPNIVTVYDFGKLPDGGAYLLLEFVEGKNLRAVLQEHGALSPALALPILGEVCAAVDFAHRRNVIHRDLKPDNIMLKRRDEGSVTVKVLDFGLAKMIEEAEMSSSITRTGELLGTPAYMSPEHCSGEDLDARSDLYSLGVIAYEMLSGRPPFRGRVAAILTAQIQQSPTPLREANPNISAALEAVVMAALAKKPADRPASVADWWAQLETAYAATYGEKPGAVIPLVLPTTTSAPATTGAVASEEAAPQPKTSQVGGEQTPRLETGTVALGAQSSAAVQTPPPTDVSAQAPTPRPRVGTGTLAIGTPPDPAEESVTMQTVVANQEAGRPRLNRLQRIGLVIGGAAALVVAGGLAATTNWLRGANTPVVPPTPTQSPVVVQPSETPPTSAATPTDPPPNPIPAAAADAGAADEPSVTADKMRRAPGRGQTNTGDDAPLNRSEMNRGADNPITRRESPPAEPAAAPSPPRQPNEARPPSDAGRTPPASRPQPDAEAARSPRADGRNQEQRDKPDKPGFFGRVGRGVKKIGETITGRAKDKGENKPRRPRD